MTISEFWRKISAHQIEGVMFHFQMIDLFEFLGLRKLSEEQENHFYEETLALRNTHKYVLDTHNILLLNDKLGTPNLIPSSWSSHTRMDVDKATRRSSVMSAFDKWRQWESDTLQFYTEMRDESDSVLDIEKLNKMIEDVGCELQEIYNTVLELKIRDFDPASLI